MDHNKLENSEVRVPDHLTCLLRILHAGQEGTVSIGQGGIFNIWQNQYNIVKFKNKIKLKNRIKK